MLFLSKYVIMRKDSFLYARLQTGRIMVWWCPPVRAGLRLSDFPSVRVSVSPFSSFLLHALTYWAGFLHMAFSYCTTDQVRVSSLCVHFWRSYATLWTQNIGNVQFSALFPTCFDVLNWNFAYGFVLMYYISNLSIVTLSHFRRSYPSFWT